MYKSTRDELHRAIYDFAEGYIYPSDEVEEIDTFAADFAGHLLSKFDIKLKETE